MVNANKMVKVFSETMSHKLIHCPQRAGLGFNIVESRKIVSQSLFMSFLQLACFLRKGTLIQPAAANGAKGFSGISEPQHRNVELKENVTWPGFLGIVFHKKYSVEINNKG